MKLKFTNTKKWDDVWFSQLSMKQKVMFMYLCDMCDLAGFLEVNKSLTTLQTGIEDVEEVIMSLSKSIDYNDGYIWIKKHIKHQKNLPINPKNGAHKAIIKSIIEHIDRFPNLFDSLPVSDSETIKKMIMGGGGGGASPPPIGIGIGISKDKGKENTVTKNEVKNESLIARLYKYFVGEENLMGESITTGTREILSEAIRLMDVEEWKIFCEARLDDEYKAAPRKFFLEDGWRRYQEDVKIKNKEVKRIETIKKEVRERQSLPEEEAPEEFKEFVKDFGKRTGKTGISSNSPS